jgi:hypothetical protein
MCLLQGLPAGTTPEMFKTAKYFGLFAAGEKRMLLVEKSGQFSDDPQMKEFFGYDIDSLSGKGENAPHGEKLTGNVKTFAQKPHNPFPKKR